MSGNLARRIRWARRRFAKALARLVPVKTPPPSIVVGDRPPISRDLARRVRSAYLHSAAAFAGSGDSPWTTIRARQQEIHDLLVRGDESVLVRRLSDPGRTDLFYGIDNLFGEFTEIVNQKSSEEDWLRQNAASVWLSLVRLAEAIGTRRAANDEAPGAMHAPSVSYDAERVLAGLDRAFGARVDFPNPFPGEVGVGTSRGVISHRPLGALYQAYRLKQLSLKYGPRVLEIGAGLGRTAYYAHLLGLGPYSIIDLPMSNVAQALFLGTVLGDRMIRLSNEPRSGSKGIEILDPAAMRELADVDMVLNADSLTEMDRADAERYADFIIRRCKVFLSVNHEVNPLRVSEVGDLAKHRVSRHPYWLRPGYVEELYVF
jgi:hypothetical protein